MFSSFTARLTAAFVGIATLTALIIVSLVNVAFDAAFSSYLAGQAQRQRGEVVAAIADSYQRNQGWDLSDLQTVTVASLSSGGNVLLESATGATIWQGPRRGSGSGPNAGSGAHAGPALSTAVRLPVEVGGDVVGFAYIRQPQLGTLAGDASFRASISWMIAGGGAAAVLVAVGLALVLARRTTRPVRRVTAAARALADGRLDARIEVSGPAEFAEMGAAFNRMGDAVEQEDQLRRSFASDVAHEMRTPLAVLLTHVEGLQDGVTQPSAAELQLLHDEVLRASRMVADLEVLGASSAARFSMKLERVDLGGTVRSAVQELQPLATERHIQLGLSAPDAVAVHGDAGRLRQVVDNLLSNALKFTPDGGSVQIGVRRDGPTAVLTVEDNGQGIPPAELPHIFERFFRGAGVRASGSGIGLAVVRELVEAHGGLVAATSRRGEGSKFVVHLPLPESDKRQQ